MRFRQKAGVLIVELALAMIVASMITGVIFSLTNLYGFTDRIDHTRERMHYIDKAMKAYLKKNGVLPVPSPLDVGYDNVLYGKAAGSYSGGSIPSGLMHSGSGSDTVFIGALPFKDLAISEDYAYDTWDSKIVYIVVADLTSSKINFAQYQTKLTNGVIEINEQGNNVLGDAANRVNAYLLLSYGKNRSGAYNSGGVKIQCVDGKKESINCNNLTSAGPFVFSAFNYLNSPDYYDDILSWTELSELRAEYDLYDIYKDSLSRYFIVNDIAGADIKNTADGVYLVQNVKNNPIVAGISDVANYSGAFVIVLAHNRNGAVIDELKNGDIVYVDGVGSLRLNGANLEYSEYNSSVLVAEGLTNAIPSGDGYYVITDKSAVSALIPSATDNMIAYKRGQLMFKICDPQEGNMAIISNKRYVYRNNQWAEEA